VVVEGVRRVNLIYAGHAREQMDARRVTEAEVELTVRQPEDQYPSREGRTVAEKSFPSRTGGRPYTVRVVYIVEEENAVIITVVRMTRKRRRR